MGRSGADARGAGPWEGTSLAGSIVARWRANPRTTDEPLPPGVRVRVHGLPRPVKCQLGGDPLRARLLEELDEPFQQPPVLGHLEPEPTTDRADSPPALPAAPGHAAPPGHGRASARSAFRSTFA